MLRYGAIPVLALTFLASTATAQTSPSRAAQLTPAEESTAVREYWERRKNAKPLSEEEKVRAAEAEARADFTLQAIMSQAISAQQAGKEDSERARTEISPAVHVLEAIRAARDSTRRGLKRDSIAGER